MGEHVEGARHEVGQAVAGEFRLVVFHAFEDELEIGLAEEVADALEDATQNGEMVGVELVFHIDGLLKLVHHGDVVIEWRAAVE